MKLKQILLPTLTLMLICTIVAGALSLTDHFTKDKIALQEQQALQASMEKLIPGAAYQQFVDENDGNLLLGYRATVDGELVGYIYRSEAMGYKSKVQVMVAFDTAGTITGVEVTDCADESPGIGQKVGTDAIFKAQFTGQSGPMEEIDAITGATYSAKAVQEAVNRASASLNKHLATVSADIPGGADQ